ncbi:hypothetical protein POM88_006810 [Heracleum sosnowskyi]|uniref:TF-B3 domain-containing protein n=1 Tax=Heracleum sosnowskyi TaxID=360622 RepID=A0AAD8N5N2_9APIA|nr:hypothetical protein POM88_006810 [Heracleum sosnowskyi]
MESIPKSFYDEFGEHLSANVKIMCKDITWEAKIDMELGKICDLGSFMKFYEIKIYNLVQFDFYGNNLFLVKKFKDSTVECEYPITNQKVFMDNEKLHTVWRKEQYVIDGWSLEYDKAHALWSFSSHHNYVNYFEKKIKFYDIDENVNNTCLNLELENLYKNWKHVTKVYLTFVERSWEIGIEWVAGKCYFGKGWSEFVTETELYVGDSLLLFKEPSSRYDNINVCIVKGKDNVIDMSEGSKEFSASFYKVLSELSINDSVLVVPKLIKDNYGWKLNDIRKVEVGGESSFVFYNYKRGYVSNLEKFMKYFNLKAGETVIFTMDSNSVEESGVEENDIGIKVAESRSIKVNLLNGRFPLFVVVLDRFTMDCNELILPERFLLECHKKIPFHVKLQMPNGHQIHVHFKKKENSLSCVSAFMKDCQKLFGCVMVFSYKGEGNFLVNVLKDDFCEVDYFEFRTIPRAPVHNQDNINGVGWKFLIRASKNAIDSFEIEIPGRFVRRFGKGIPGTVSFVLRNGKNFSGQYLHNERKILGLVEIIMYTHLEEGELCLFTYCGNGKFEIVVFDISKVEKNFEYTVTEDDVNNSEEVLLENTAGNEIIDAEMTDESMDSDTNMENVNGETIVQYIPGYIKPGNRNFRHGWNQFAKYNKLSLNETVTMVDEEDGLSFEIGFPGRD